MIRTIFTTAAVASFILGFANGADARSLADAGNAQTKPQIVSADPINPRPNRGYLGSAQAAGSPLAQAEIPSIGAQEAVTPLPGTAGGNNNCHARFVVEKIQTIPVTFNTQIWFKAPSAIDYTLLATHTDMLENAVNPLAIHAARRLCWIANDAERLNTPCPEVEFDIEGALTGFGVETCTNF